MGNHFHFPSPENVIIFPLFLKDHLPDTELSVDNSSLPALKNYGAISLWPSWWFQ
jgi:hypothetical protein